MAYELAQAYEKEDQPEGLNAQADQVLSWLAVL